MDLDRLHSLLNTKRKNPLQRLINLDDVASLHCVDMRQDGRLHHNRFKERIRNSGEMFTSCGEIVAKGQKSPEEVLSSWMKSRGHRRNITNESFDHCGISYLDGYWCVVFIDRRRT